MASFAEIIAKGPCFYKGNGATALEISNAEKQLGVTFSNEYRDYLRNYSVVGISGHEITGITANEESNVIRATVAGRESADRFDASWYVVEKANIDGILVWQDETGRVIQTAIGEDPILLAASLAEYVVQF